MHRIKEVEIAKSKKSLMTSQSIAGRTDFPHFDKLGAMIESALKRLLDKHIHFRKRVSVEEQRAQKFDRFLRGRQIAYIIYEHFCATGAYEAGSQICSVYVCRMTTSKTSTFDGIMLYHQRAKCLQT